MDKRIRNAIIVSFWAYIFCALLTPALIKIADIKITSRVQTLLLFLPGILCSYLAFLATCKLWDFVVTKIKNKKNHGDEIKNEHEMNAEEIVEEVIEAAEEPVEETAEGTATFEKKKSPVAAIIAIVALIAVLAVAAVFVVRHFNKSLDEETAEPIVEVTAAHHTNAHGYPSWSIHYAMDENSNVTYSYLDENAQTVTLTSDEVNTKLNEVVATCGEMTLDNRTLQYYYGDSLNTFYNQYYTYISYMMDTSAPLDSQMDSSMGDGTTTWQNTFLQSGLSSFYSTAAMVQEAEKNSFTMSEDDQSYLNSMMDLETLAMMYGYPDSITLIKALLGPMATVESYQQYIKDTMLASCYTQFLAESIEITDQEIEDYYNANESVFLGQNIQKIDQNVMNIRHILIQPEAAEDGTISEEAWAAAETEAQRILDEWKAGEATETSFGELAGTYSTDTGSSSMGGLYEDVYPGQMVTEFNDWCFDEARQPGDTDIVKTTYGYHIMYYVSEGDYIYWKNMCEETLLSEKVVAIRDELLEAYEVTADIANMILLDTSVATTPAAETADAE